MENWGKTSTTIPQIFPLKIPQSASIGWKRGWHGCGKWYGMEATTHTVNLNAIKQAIASQKGGYKWRRSSYEYALSGMYTYYTDWSDYKLPEIKEMFYKRCETHFHLIKSFTTFRNVDCYVKNEVNYTDLPRNEYFVVTNDYIEPGSQFQDATKEQLAQIKKDGYTAHFRMYDDDGIHYYSGYLRAKYEGTQAAFSPLVDYGMPNAGCTDIKYKEKDGKYHSL